MQGERLLLVATPALAMAAVALGLRVGAHGAVRAAIVWGAPSSAAGTGLAWQVSVFDDDHGVREPAALQDVEVTARARDRVARWSGATDEDGVAEALLALPQTSGITLELHAGGRLLARGDAAPSGPFARPEPASAWTRFARREGAIGLDVAVVGQRVASGFPASIWVRASDAATHAVIAGASIEPERDGSLSPAGPESRTDSRGWAHIVATPMGHAVALVLHARAQDGRTGDWAGALFVSPGAARLIARDRYGSDERPAIDVVFPNVRSTAYVEIDDARGRAWATAIPLPSSVETMPRASVLAPKLAPGLYWTVASSDPAGGGQLGPGTIVRPFFVAESDQAALAFGTDAAECAPPLDPRDVSRVLGVCLALAGATPVPRWMALDGFSAQHARDAAQRATGLFVSVGAIGVAMLLEALLLLRTAQRTRLALRAATADQREALGAGFERAGRLGIGVLVALLGFALLAAFLVRAG